MNTYIYLDTARLGQMCPEAQAADRDFARLASEEAGSLYYDIFLRGGFYGLSPSMRNRYPGLSGWGGVPNLKRRIQIALGMSVEHPMLLANRTAQLVRLACRTLCRRCENILVTDMLWPAYRKTLEAECHRSGCKLTTLHLAKAVLYECIPQAELIDQIVNVYRRENCHGLLLSAVTCHGVRLPIAEVVQTISKIRRPRFTVVDAAQAVNHIPLHETARHADFIISGTHKWLQAYHPMGLGFCCRPRAESEITESFQEMLPSGELDDPLLLFTTELETDSCQTFSETVNLAPLFTTTAAIERLLHTDQSCQAKLENQKSTADCLVQLTKNTAWSPLRPDTPYRTGILLLHAKSKETRNASPEKIRNRFRRQGIALTAYDGGLIRTSIPPENLETRNMLQIRRAVR